MSLGGVNRLCDIRDLLAGEICCCCSSTLILSKRSPDDHPDLNPFNPQSFLLCLTGSRLIFRSLPEPVLLRHSSSCSQCALLQPDIRLKLSRLCKTTSQTQTRKETCPARCKLPPIRDGTPPVFSSDGYRCALSTRARRRSAFGTMAASVADGHRRDFTNKDDKRVWNSSGKSHDHLDGGFRSWTDTLVPFWNK